MPFPEEISKSINSRARSIMLGFQELSERGEYYAGVVALSIGCAVFSGIEAAEQAGEVYEISSGVTTAMAVGFGYAALREKRKRQADNFQSRQFSKDIDFGEYEYKDEEMRESFVSPFPAFVIGLDYEQLGVGLVIGALKDDFDNEGIPIVSIKDPKSPTGEVELLGTGSECYWSPLRQYTVDKLMTSEARSESLVSAYDYARKLDVSW